MKKSIWIIATVAIVVAVVGSLVGASIALADPAGPQASSSKTLRVAHISDNHVMIEELCNPYSDTFKSGSIASGKMLGQTKELTIRALEDILAQAKAGDAPMYVFDTGDLTSNGELANMMGVASVLKEYTAKIRAIEGYEGFQIFVIPGNHDIYNQNAYGFMPTPDDPEEYARFAAMSAQEKEEYLSGLGKVSVRTTTNLEFMTLFSDFGYCNCPERKEGKHLETCGMADGCQLEFFYESDFWYEPTTLSNTPVVLAEEDQLDLIGSLLDPDGNFVYDREYQVLSGGVNAMTIEEGGDEMKAAVDAFNASPKDFRLTAKYSRHGACSYIARVGMDEQNKNGLTVIGFDGDSRKWKQLKDTDNIAKNSSGGWDETTGGVILDEMMQWAFDSLDQHQDAQNGNVVVALGHINILPHFDTEDEVISLFTYDNWEQLSTNLANHDVRYTFSGHQHAMDIEINTAQSGKVLYDIETGSLSSMGSGWRDLAITQTWYADGSYSEDVASKVNFCDYNDQLDGKKVFRYKLPKAKSDGSLDWEVTYERDGETYVGIDYALGKGLRNMIVNLIAGYVNDGLYDRLRGMFSGLAGGSMDGIYHLLDSLVDQVEKLRLVPFIPNADGTDFTMGTSPQEGYDLIDFAEDFVGYLLDYDFSYGKGSSKMTLGDLLWEVYGAHLVGAHDTNVPEDLLPMLDSLNNGDFLRMVEDMLYRGLMPQLEIILNAPIYWGEGVEYVRVDEDASPVTLDDVKDGKGFDVSEYADAVMELSFSIVNVGDTIRKYADVSSLFNLVRSLPRILDGMGVTKNGVYAPSIIIKPVLDSLLKGKDISKYVNTALDYIAKIDDYDSLSEMIKGELLDKYVTTAFCKNIGNYGMGILLSMIQDDSPDGVKWDWDRAAAGDPFPFVSEATDVRTAFKTGFFNVTPAPLDATNYTVNGVVHTYYRNAQGNDTLPVTPTKDNGMVPSMITMNNVVDGEGNLDVTRKALRWWTRFDVDVTDVDEDGISNLQHKTTIRYGESETALDHSVEVTGVNVSIEYPTIDLGITYINMTYAFREYNRYDVVLSGLTAGKTYYYQLGSDATGWTEVYSFEALPVDGGLEYLAISDIQGSVERNYILSLLNVQKALEKGNPQVVISMGDNVDKGENINQWGWLLNDHDVVYAEHSFETVAGNHEDDNFCISDIVTVNNGATVSNTGYYYSYNYQGVHMVYLDTNDLSAKNDLSAAQIAWLEDDLQAAKANANVDFIVVCLHKGPFTAGSHAFDTDVIAIRHQLTPILVDNGVDLVLQGHDHTYSVSQYIVADPALDEDGDEIDGRYTFCGVTPTYDATGAAVDPQGVLFVNLGTMGDKFYNYIYSDEVPLKDRSNDYANKEVLSDYFVGDKLELKPEYSVKGGVAIRSESPVYAYLKAKDGRLSLTTYTVIDGVSYVVDDIAITKSPKAVDQATSFKVLGKTYHADDLKDVEVVRFAVAGASGMTYYSGYRLSDLDGHKDYTSGGKRYLVKDTYVALYSSKVAGEAGTKLDEPICFAFTPNGVKVVDIEAAQDLTWWAILLIVIGSLIVMGGIVCMILFIPGKNRKPIVDVNALRAKPQKFDNQELTKEESKEEDDVE